ncbi:response regulator [Natronococcus sp. A-GB1]|uniref:response regulator n=1 Tax=Natronococcus sp. A-GB1 TaxID=3037648 RepID=UPI00241F7495|nr:response regulator [Natronococcus sp. A-GB1]MDG5759623.1 response regulator [Natronococcus sp. A-GB1]
MESKQFSTPDVSALGRSQYEAGSEDRVRLLLIENDPEDARRAREAFETVTTDTEIEVATDGSAALELLCDRVEESEPIPDLVLLALDLPEVDGFEFLETVRDDEDLVQLPVLVLAESSASSDVNDSYERAANAYLAKPSDPDEFETVAGAIERFWFRRVSLPPHGF